HDKVMDVLPLIWVGGMVLLFLWLFAVYTIYHWKLRSIPAVTDRRILAVLARTKVKMKIHKNIPLLMQTTVSAPSLFGLVHPKILLSPAVKTLSEQELEYILLHELAHYKRKDPLINYLLLGLQIVHWFNPMLWYCFLRIREDLEAATDECVLAVLTPLEHKAYGLTLLTVLDSFTAPTLAPKLLGMVDDKNSIKRRLARVKMATYYQNKRFRVVAVGLLSLLLLGTVLLTSGLNKPSESIASNSQNAEKLFSYKTPYVGDNSKVVNILNNLPFSQYRKDVSLHTSSKPHGITVNYNFNGTEPELLEATLHDNATLMFALIENVDLITFNVDPLAEQFVYQRDTLESYYGQSLWAHSTELATFTTFLQNINFKVFIFPKVYTPTMSSTPGIRICAYSDYRVVQVRYETNHGSLLSWASDKVTQLTTIADLPYEMPVYWSALDASGKKTAQDLNTVTVTLLDGEGNTLAKKKIMIVFDGNAYSVAPAPDIIIGVERQQTIDEAISRAIKAQGSSYLAGEVLTEGHILLETEENDGIITAYTIASIGWFGFENNIFTITSGSGGIPTVITFSQNESGQLALFQYKKPQDGGGYLDSVKEMFPQRLWDRILHNNNHNDSAELSRQQEAQAQAYLRSIGRNERVQVAHVDKDLVNIDVQASNKLFSELTKFNPELNTFPNWLGTRETVVNGERFVYETIQEKTESGTDLVIFRKTKDKVVVLEFQYEIVGSEPNLISPFSRPEATN
ncbi:MAG: M56 family metallopeptidase, partial [Firmicutes bacterium]|nr:M56 family metallopeptidase [Bacillota bacterium]